MHNDQKFQRLSLKKGFLFPSEDVIDILIITRNSRVLFEEIDSKLLNEGIILNFYISKFKFTKVSCVYYCNLSVRIIGKNRVNEDACNDILRISGPLDDKF